LDLLGRVLLARYRLDAKLGAGGSAEVYAARDLQLERRVAVKVLHPGLADDARFRRRFSAEATSAAQLSHPGIVGVYDSGCDGVPYIVMELVDGGSLQDVLDEGRTLSPAQAAALGAEVATALAYAHRRGVVHRDLKPGNILLTAEGRAKVADFGIARAMADAQWTEPLVVLGTARYTPPEALEGEAYTPAGDVYSLGLVLAEAVAGVPVFNAETPVAVLAGRLRARTPLPDCGPLQPVLETATATDPTDRYPDAHSLEVELAPLATGAEPIAPAGRASGRGGCSWPAPAPSASSAVCPWPRPPPTSATWPSPSPPPFPTTRSRRAGC
jgi:serine/threonine-protein kinase